MSIKQSLVENKSFILESLPTQELKDQFLKNMESAPDKVEPTNLADQIKEARAPDHVKEELYDGIKKELESYKPAPKMTPEEEKAEIEMGLKNPPKSEANNE